MAPFLVDRKCPRIYYSDFNYRNRVGIKGVYKGCAFFRGWNLLYKKSAVIFLQHLLLYKSDTSGFNCSRPSSSSSPSCSSSLVYPTLPHCTNSIHSNVPKMQSIYVVKPMTQIWPLSNCLSSKIQNTCSS
jgi:hypothetical protein